MNTTSASHVDTLSAEPAAAAVPVPVWDAAVRVFHWLMVLCFAGAWITADSERWRLLHVTLGYTMGGLIAFRVIWGLVGTRHARFASFVRGPRAVAAYLRSLWHGRPQHHSGHNPAGAWAVLGLLGMTALVVFSGWATYEEVWAHWPEDLHEGAANALMALVIVHVLGVVVSSVLHRENLVRAMVSGRKQHVPPGDAIKRSWRAVAALLLAGVLAFWALQWRAPLGGVLPDRERAAVLDRAQGDDEEDD
jgi:cytochrome b